MSTFDRVLEELKENKRIRLAGGHTCIPWLNLPKLSTVVPGVQKRRYYICTANSKVGKTQMADFLFLYEPFDFIENHKTNLDVRIFYFSLELSAEEKIKQAITRQVHIKTGEIISPEKISSVFDYILDDKTEKLVESFGDYFEKFNKKVTFIDNIRNPFGIYTYIRNYAENNGNYFDKDNNKLSLTSAREHPLTIDRYVPNNPNEYVIIMTDHLSLLTPEQGNTPHQTMTAYSSNYCLKMRDRFGYTIVNVQQQAADQEKQQFISSTGRTIIDKLRPSPDGLGDNKLTGRDCDVMFGLFAPHRYKIDIYPQPEGYDITSFKDSYRELSILLNRRGSGFINTHLYFNGAINYFRELPKPSEINYSKLLI